MTWQEINRRRLPFIRLGERLFRGVYSEVRRDLIASFENLTTPEEFIQKAAQLNILEESFLIAYQRLYLKTGIAFAKNKRKSLHRDLEIKQGEEDIWYDKIVEYVRQYSGIKISDITKTHYRDIERITRKTVETGINEGWGMEKIARSIKKEVADIDLWKAMRIARTEVISASNEGVKIGAEDLPGNKEKVWISTFDDRSRPDHMAMDGVRVPYGENFTLPSGVQLEYPGDQKVNAPEETINCRCGYEIIVSSETY